MYLSGKFSRYKGEWENNNFKGDPIPLRNDFVVPINCTEIRQDELDKISHNPDLSAENR